MIRGKAWPTAVASCVISGGGRWLGCLRCARETRGGWRTSGRSAGCASRSRAENGVAAAAMAPSAALMDSVAMNRGGTDRPGAVMMMQRANLEMTQDESACVEETVREGSSGDGANPRCSVY